MTSTTRRRLIALSDQALQAGGFLLATVLLARWLPLEDFAVIATMLTVWFFFEAIQRTGILMPYIATVPVPEQDLQGHMLWMVFNVAFVVAALLLVFVAGRVFSGVAGQAMGLALLVMPCAAMFTHAKRTLHHMERYGGALAASALNTATLLVMLSLIGTGVMARDAEAAMWAYASGYFVAALLALWLMRRAMVAVQDVLHGLLARLRMVSTMSAGAICAYFYNNGVQFVVAVLANAADAAAFSATRVLVRPLNVVSSAITDIERSSASRIYHQGGRRALDRFLLRLSVLLGVPLLLLGTALYVQTPWILNQLFEGKYDSYAQAGQAWLLVLLPQLVALPLDMRQSVMSRGRALLGARFSGAMTCGALLAWFHLSRGQLDAVAGIWSVGGGRCVVLCVMAFNQWRDRPQAT